jgi:hypothetical protein
MKTPVAQISVAATAPHVSRTQNGAELTASAQSSRSQVDFATLLAALPESGSKMEQKTPATGAVKADGAIPEAQDRHAKEKSTPSDTSDQDLPQAASSLRQPPELEQSVFKPFGSQIDRTVRKQLQPTIAAHESVSTASSAMPRTDFPETIAGLFVAAGKSDVAQGTQRRSAASDRPAVFQVAAAASIAATKIVLTPAQTKIPQPDHHFSAALEVESSVPSPRTFGKHVAKSEDGTVLPVAPEVPAREATLTQDSQAWQGIAPEVNGAHLKQTSKMNELSAELVQKTPHRSALYSMIASTQTQRMGAPALPETEMTTPKAAGILSDEPQPVRLAAMQPSAGVQTPTQTFTGSVLVPQQSSERLCIEPSATVGMGSQLPATPLPAHAQPDIHSVRTDPQVKIDALGKSAAIPMPPVAPPLQKAPTTSGASMSLSVVTPNAEQSSHMDQKLSLLTGAGPSELFNWDPARAVMTQQNPAQPLRNDLALHVSRQLVDVMAQAVHRPIEIALSPQELGRVRMSITTEDGAITVNILAERPETLDLMRRHVDQLGQTFRTMGYDSITFSFGAGAGGGSQPDMSKGGESPETAGGTSAAPHEPDQAAGSPTVTINLDNAQTSGVDIRL